MLAPRHARCGTLLLQPHERSHQLATHAHIHSVCLLIAAEPLLCQPTAETQHSLACDRSGHSWLGAGGRTVGLWGGRGGGALGCAGCSFSAHSLTKQQLAITGALTSEGALCVFDILHWVHPWQRLPLCKGLDDRSTTAPAAASPCACSYCELRAPACPWQPMGLHFIAPFSSYVVSKQVASSTPICARVAASARPSVVKRCTDDFLLRHWWIGRTVQPASGWLQCTPTLQDCFGRPGCSGGRSRRGLVARAARRRDEGSDVQRTMRHLLTCSAP